MGAPHSDELDAAKHLEKLIQDSKDQPAELAVKLNMILQHMRTAGRENTMPYQVISRAMTMVITQHGLNAETLNPLPHTSACAIQIGGSSSACEPQPDNHQQDDSYNLNSLEEMSGSGRTGEAQHSSALPVELGTSGLSIQTEINHDEGMSDMLSHSKGRFNSNKMGASSIVEIEASRFLQKLNQETEDDPEISAKKLRVVLQHLKSLGMENTMQYQVTTRAMETIIEQNGSDVEALKKSSPCPSTGGTNVGSSSSTHFTDATENDAKAGTSENVGGSKFSNVGSGLSK